jgi:outer membrane protein
LCQLIATITRPSIKAKDTSLGDVKVGAVTVLPPTLTAQWHFSPHSAFNPYVGAGVTAFILFAKDSAGAPVTKVHADNHLGAAIQAGFDYDFAPNWFFNAEINQIFVKTHAVIETTVGESPGPIPPAAPGATVKAKSNINPFLVGVGIGYRF